MREVINVSLKIFLVSIVIFVGDYVSENILENFTHIVGVGTGFLATIVFYAVDNLRNQEEYKDA